MQQTAVTVGMLDLVLKRDSSVQKAQKAQNQGVPQSGAELRYPYSLLCAYSETLIKNNLMKNGILFGEGGL